MIESRDIQIHLPFSGLSVAGISWGHEESQNKYLAIHGWLDNAASFTPLMESLQRDDLHVISIDLPGHGLSDHLPKTTLYVYETWIRLVDDVIEGLDWKKLSLLGHSLGAGIACTLAALIPDRIERVILIEGIGPLSMQDSDVVGRMKKFRDTLRTRAGRTLPTYATREEAITARAHAGLDVTSAKLLASRGLKSVGDRFTWRTDFQVSLPSPWRFNENQVREFLKAIECPVYLIQSSVENIPEIYSERAELIRKICRAELFGSHHIHMEQPREVARLVEGFLASEESGV